MYAFYAKHKDVFCERVRILYTDTDSFFFHFFVEDLAQVRNRDQSMRDWFDFSEIPANHLNGLGAPNYPHGAVVGYFKDEMKGEQVYEVIALKPKSYSVCSVKATIYNLDSEMPPPVYIHKAVAKGITRAIIKRLTHEDYRQMYNEVENCRKVINRRIGTKLHKVTQFII